MYNSRLATALPRRRSEWRGCRLKRTRSTRPMLHTLPLWIWMRNAPRLATRSDSSCLRMGLEGAECLFDRALALDPLNAQYCYRRGVVLQQRRQPVEAAEAFTNALQQDPRFVGALFNLGVAHRELGDHRSAAEDFRRILQLDPENQSAHCLLG